MGEKKVVKTLVIALMALVMCGFCRYTFASFSLSVTPYEGGYDLRYGKIGAIQGRVNKEVVVSITSDSAKQYRVVQNILDPLSTPEGNELFQNSMVVYGLRSSNKYGTLNAEQEQPIRMGRQVLYTSNQSGESDSFTLVYGLMITPDTPAGLYRGRIGFTLEPVDGVESPATVILNISAEVEVESSIEIRSVKGTTVLTLNSEHDEDKTTAVAVEIKGGFGKQLRIVQIVEQQPISEDGTLLNWDTVQFRGENAHKGSVITETVTLSSRPQVIYTSSGLGEADSFLIEYSLGDLSTQKTGQYRTTIKYLLEGINFNQNRLIRALELVIDNPRRFELVIKPEAAGILRFANLKPRQPPKLQEVVFQVNTNIGKQYQVTQHLSSLLTNVEGRVIPTKYFTLRQENLGGKGEVKYTEQSQIKEGEMVLFISDKEGGPASFKVVYQLDVPSDVHWGDYSATFTYSLAEI